MSLVGQPLEDLAVGSPLDVPLTVDVDRYQNVDPSASLPLELTGEIAAPGRHSMVALAVNGTVAAVVKPEESTAGWLHALLLPDPFKAHDNDIQAFVVEGDDGSLTLRPIPLRDG